MEKFRIGYIAFLIAIIIGHLIIIDYKNPGWSNNGGSYLGILAMIILIVAMIISKRNEKRQSEKKK